MREIREETGIKETQLPTPTIYLKIRFGNYYIYDLPEEIPLIPEDKKEVMNIRWASIEEMKAMNLNVDANIFIKSDEI